MSRNNSISITQSKAERRLLRRYKKEINNANIAPYRFYLDTDKKKYIDLDGFEENEYAIEIFAHVGSLKSGQKRKIASDILKLTLTDVKKKILIVHKDVKAILNNNSWITNAIERHGITVVEGRFTKTLEGKLIETQKKQDVTRK